MSLDRWTTFLETGERRELYELAIRSIELVDFQVEAPTRPTSSPRLTWPPNLTASLGHSSTNRRRRLMTPVR
jgi:hypothetical protein